MITAALLAKSLGTKLDSGKALAHCPVCQTEARPDQKALSISDNRGRLLVHCFKDGCEFREICESAGLSLSANLVESSYLNAGPNIRKRSSDSNRQKVQKLIARMVPILGTPAEVYLRRERGITCSLNQLPLGYVDHVYHAPSQSHVGALIAPVEPTGGLLRIFLKPDGTRLEQNAKLMLGPCSVGAVKLTHTSEKLIVAEGLETALSMLCGLARGRPAVWAALSTSGMKALELPAQPGGLVIAADGDNAGRNAAEVLAKRAKNLSWDVSILPAPNGRDWNDVLLGRRR